MRLHEIKTILASKGYKNFKYDQICKINNLPVLRLEDITADPLDSALYLRTGRSINTKHGVAVSFVYELVASQVSARSINASVDIKLIWASSRQTVKKKCLKNKFGKVGWHTQLSDPDAFEQVELSEYQTYYSSIVSQRGVVAEGGFGGPDLNSSDEVDAKILTKFFDAISDIKGQSAIGGRADITQNFVLKSIKKEIERYASSKEARAVDVSFKEAISEDDYSMILIRPPKLDRAHSHMSLSVMIEDGKLYYLLDFNILQKEKLHLLDAGKLWPMPALSSTMGGSNTIGYIEMPNTIAYIEMPAFADPEFRLDKLTQNIFCIIDKFRDIFSEYSSYLSNDAEIRAALFKKANLIAFPRDQ